MESRVRCWIEREDNNAEPLWVIRSEIYIGLDTDGNEVWKARRDYTGLETGPNPASLMALIRKEGWEFLPEHSDWTPEG